MDNNLVPGLTEQVKHLEDDIKTIKENNKFLFEKLDKAYGDRIELRAENFKLKEQVNGTNGKSIEEEECLACSA
jgi:FtsZ-binding cell division protein ZapB